MAKRRDILRAQAAPAAKLRSEAPAPDEPDHFERSARIVEEFARGKDGRTSALLARISFALRHQPR